MAIGAGATYIEKHITLNRKEKGLDYQAALEPLEFKDFVKTIRTASVPMGTEQIKSLGSSEMQYRKFQKKSIVAIRNIKEGEIYGVEPFVTIPIATGRVDNLQEAHIFRYSKNKSLKNPYAKKILSFIKKNYLTLPFTERRLKDFMNSSEYKNAFSELLSSKALISYPVFIEASM